MVCWMMFLDVVKNYLREYNVTDQEAKEILLDIENEVGHNKDLIKAVVDFEKEGLIKRLKKKKKAKGREKEMAYA
jgi:hypothetical protein